MKRMLRISVADDEPDIREFFRIILPQLGHDVVSVAASGSKLIADCSRHHPNLIITDVRMSDMDGIDAANRIYEAEAIPVILVPGDRSPALIERAGGSHILAYLVKPVKQEDIKVAIAIALQQFEQIRAVQKEVTNARQALIDRKLIERGRGILMKRARLDEDSAFRRMQLTAGQKNKRLVEIARILIAAEEAWSVADE